jgi:hypothetical protein
MMSSYDPASAVRHGTTSEAEQRPLCGGFAGADAKLEISGMEQETASSIRLIWGSSGTLT